jgi:hypothetical protein
MAEDGIQFQYMNIVRRIVDPMRVEYFFSNSFTHNVSQAAVCGSLLIIPAMHLVQVEFEEDRI